MLTSRRTARVRSGRFGGAGTHLRRSLGAAAVAAGSKGKATATVFGEGSRKRTYVDFGLYLRANGEPFELWAERASYADPDPRPVAVLARRGDLAQHGDAPLLRTAPLSSRSRYHHDAQGQRVAAFDVSSCGDKGFGNMPPVRVQPDAPDASAYPIGCPTHPCTLGSVLGIQAGWGHQPGLQPPNEAPTGQLHRARGDRASLRRDVRARRRRVAEDLSAGLHTSTPTAARPRRPRAGRLPAGTTAPHRREPGVPSAGAPAGAQVDLRSLPAFGISLNKKGLPAVRRDGVERRSLLPWWSTGSETRPTRI